MTTERAGGAGAVVLIVALALGGGLTGCGAGGEAAPTTAGAGGGAMPTPHATPAHETALGPAMDAAGISAVWKVRPGFVAGARAQTQAAYAFALERPDVVQWLPCYCGCAAMDHRSNLDCFFKRRTAGAPITYEEHASYCDVCVRTALLAKGMVARGATLQEVRAAVDAEFGGGGVPGTPTELPPA